MINHYGKAGSFTTKVRSVDHLVLADRTHHVAQSQVCVTGLRQWKCFLGYVHDVVILLSCFSCTPLLMYFDAALDGQLRRHTMTLAACTTGTGSDPRSINSGFKHPSAILFLGQVHSHSVSSLHIAPVHSTWLQFTPHSVTSLHIASVHST